MLSSKMTNLECVQAISLATPASHGFPARLETAYLSELGKCCVGLVDRLRDLHDAYAAEQNVCIFCSRCGAGCYFAILPALFRQQSTTQLSTSGFRHVELSRGVIDLIVLMYERVLLAWAQLRLISKVKRWGGLEA